MGSERNYRPSFAGDYLSKEAEEKLRRVKELNNQDSESSISTLKKNSVRPGRASLRGEGVEVSFDNRGIRARPTEKITPSVEEPIVFPAAGPEEPGPMLGNTNNREEPKEELVDINFGTEKELLPIDTILISEEGREEYRNKIRNSQEYKNLLEQYQDPNDEVDEESLALAAKEEDGDSTAKRAVLVLLDDIRQGRIKLPDIAAAPPSEIPPVVEKVTSQKKKKGKKVRVQSVHISNAAVTFPEPPLEAPPAPVTPEPAPTQSPETFKRDAQREKIPLTEKAAQEWLKDKLGLSNGSVYGELRGKEREQADKKLVEATASLWSHFMDQGKWYYDPSEKRLKVEEKQLGDVEAKVLLGMLKQANLDGYIYEFSKTQSRGKKELGWANTLNSKGFLGFDKSIISSEKATAAEVMYRLLDAGKIYSKDDEAPAVAAAIAHKVVYNDMFKDEAQLEKSPHTLRGMNQFLNYPQLLMYIRENGPGPSIKGNTLELEKLLDREITPDEEKRYDLVQKVKGKSRERNCAEEQEKKVKAAQEILSKGETTLRQEGHIAFSDDWGKLFVNIVSKDGERFPGGAAMVKAQGTYDGYLQIDETNNSYVFRYFKRPDAVKVENLNLPSGRWAYNMFQREPNARAKDFNPTELLEKLGIVNMQDMKVGMSVTDAKKKSGDMDVVTTPDVTIDHIATTDTAQPDTVEPTVEPQPIPVIDLVEGDTSPTPEVTTPEPQPVGPEEPNPEQPPIEPGQPALTPEQPTPAPETPPVPPEPEKPEETFGKKKAYLIDVSEVVQAYAHREAEKQMEELKNSSSFLKRAYIRFGEKRYLDRYYAESLQEIQNNKNLMTEIETRIFKRSIGKVEEGSKKTHYEVLDSLFDEYDKELADAEEKGEVVIDAGVNQAAAELFAGYASGNFASREDFDKAVEEKILPLVRDRKFSADDARTAEAQGLMYSNNFFELAKQYKEYIEKKAAGFGPEHKAQIMEQIKGEMAIDLQLGLKQRDLYETKPQATLKWYEKFVDKVQNIPILNKLAANPVTYGLVGGVVGTLVGRGVKRAALTVGLVGVAAVSAPVAAILGGMTLGGVYAGMRRSRDLQYDRGMDLRRATLGAEVGGPRTAAMREFQYDHKKADELVGLLRNVMSKEGLSDADKDILAEITARIKVEKEKSVDLIGVSSAEGAKYKTKALGMKELKLALRDAQTKFHLSDDDLRPLVTEWSRTFVSNIEAKDKSFKKYRRIETVKAGAIGAAVGLVAGAVVQHGIHEAREFFGDTPKTESAIEHLYHYIKGDAGAGNLAEVQVPIPNTHDLVTVKVPEGSSLNAVDDHFDMVDSKGEKITEVFINKDGSLTNETIKNLEDLGYETKDIVSDVHEQNPIDYFKDQLAEHKRTDWHDELGKRYSSFFNKLIEYEGKQQMLYVNRAPDGSVFIDANKIADNLVKNIEGAFKEFGTNPDGSVDSKLAHLRDQILEWQKEGSLAQHLQAAVIPTEEANKAGLSMLVDGADNKFRLSLPKEVSDMFTTEESLKYLHHPVKYMELRLDGHVVATTIGEDMPPVAVPFHNPEIIPPQDWTPPPVLPFYPRKPLEAAEHKKVTDIPGEYYYSYGGEGYGLLPRDKYDARISQKILRSRNLDLSHDDDDLVSEYLDKQNPAYRAELEQMTASQPMSNQIEVSITVPAYHEGKNLEKTLSSYAHMKGKNKFEVVILENHPADTERDDTAEVIEKVKAKYPDLNIVHLYKKFDKKPAIGSVRKYLVDAVLVRKQKAGVKKSIAIASNDADLEGINENYAYFLAEDFRNNPKVDAVGAKWDYPREAFAKYPLLHAAQRLWHYFDITFRNNYLKAPELIGRNSAYRSGAYAVVGGYNETSQLAEDLEMGWLIKHARGYDTSRIIYDNRADLISNPRRAVVRMVGGGRLIEQYGDFHVNEDVRRAPLEQLLADKKDFTEDAFKQEVQSIYDHYGRWRQSRGGWIEDKFVDVSFRRAMGFLGVNYEVHDDQVVITDMSKLKAGLEKHAGGAGATQTEKPEVTPEKARGAGAETREAEKKETIELSFDEVKNIISSELAGTAKINRLELVPVPEGARLSAELDAGMSGGKVVVDGLVVNTPDALAVQNLQIDARWYVKSRIEEKLASFADAIKDYLRARYNRPVSNIKVVGSSLVVGLEKQQQPTQSVRTVETIRRTAKENKLMAVVNRTTAKVNTLKPKITRLKPKIDTLKIARGPRP